MPHKLLTFSSGGWLLALATAITILTAAWSVQFVVKGFNNRPVGDGKNPETYGFDLTTCLVDRALIVGSGMPRDGKKVLNRPAFLTLAQLEDRRQTDPHDKYLVPSDRVVGVSVGLECRAYPLQILNVHEIVQDQIAGVPIAVTYSPPCDSVVVFDRRFKGQTLDFGFSGLLYNSNLVMYDRQSDPKKSSLWSQLGMRAIAGPAAKPSAESEPAEIKSNPVDNENLQILKYPTGSYELTTWGNWIKSHSDTLVLNRDLKDKERYEKHLMLPEEYYTTDRLAFPVSPLPPTGEMIYKTRCLIVTLGAERKVYPLPVMAKLADENGRWKTKLGQLFLEFKIGATGRTAQVTFDDPANPPAVIYSFWFAWFAQHPEDPLFVP